MKLLLLLNTLVLLVFGEASAQEISRINFPLIFQAVSTPESDYYYPELLKRFQQNDTTMTSVDYSHLYYGNVMQPGYNPKGASLGGESFAKLMAQKKYAAAQRLLNSELEKNPVSLCLAYQKAQLAYMQQDFKEEKYWLVKFEGLLQAILESGDGLSEQTALVVTSSQDEAPVLQVLGLNPVGNSTTVASKYDLHVLSTPNELEANKLYFNIEIPYQRSKSYVGNTYRSGAVMEHTASKN